MRVLSSELLTNVDESVIALAHRCLHLRSLDLYSCENTTDRDIYSFAQSRARNKHKTPWPIIKKISNFEEEGLANLNISQCTVLTPPAVKVVCDSFPSLHTCPGRHSLIICVCLSLTSVHCACAVHGDTMQPPHQLTKVVNGSL